MNKVQLVKSHPDFEAVVLGSFGFAASHIAEQTGMTTGQVYYRLKKAGIRLTDYRKGVGPVAKFAINQGRKFATTAMDAQIRKMLVAK